VTGPGRPGPVVDVRDLTKVFGAAPVVDGLTLQVSSGQVAALLGPNGAGKSTAIGCIVGTIRATAGEVRLFGGDPHHLPDPARMVGMVLGSDGMEPGHRARYHLTTLAVACGLPRSRVDEVLDACGLAEVGARRIGTLSTGERQRLAIASALLGDPELLVLDEPANGLDAEGVRWLRDLVAGHADRGGAVLVTSHLLHEVEHVATDVTILSRTVRFQGPIGVLTADGAQSLEDRYFSILGDDAGRLVGARRSAAGSDAVGPAAGGGSCGT
jgi:ABC-2 type transport system ATP-binding protein